ncbi:MAG: hypothetical protein OXJ37_20435 [Bryobacterales bacterium]|nr:hypothetical protein [Bryobacterales bacterium]
MEVDQRLAQIALERTNGSSFEEFFKSFYPAIVGTTFVPLGGMHDGGADAFESTDLYENPDQRPLVFYQASIQKEYRPKIRHTIKRLREYGRDPKILNYVTSIQVSAIDREEEELSSELDVTIRIRDRSWIVANINSSPQTQIAFDTYLKPTLSFLSELGSATTVGNSPRVPARTLCVFLGQEIELRRKNTDLREAVTDSLILWALEGTDPDKDLFMTREEILGKIESALPSSKTFVRTIFDSRIHLMASKGNPTGREIRWHKKDKKYCLPYHTRKIITQENAVDESIKLQVLAIYEQRARPYTVTDESLSTHQIASLSHRVLELTFERNGLEFAAFLAGQQESDQMLTVADQVDDAILDFGFQGEQAINAKEATLAVLRSAFYNSTEIERIYYGKLSRTYTLMFTLRHEPQIVDYFKSMSSNFVLFVGSDIIVRALSERYLKKEDQMTINMLQILRDAGSTLVVTHMTVEEVQAHIRVTDNEFLNCFGNLEPYVDQHIARQSGKILIRAYFYSRFDSTLKTRPTSWRAFIEQICNYNDLYSHSRSREQVKNYLIEKFDLQYFSEADVRGLVDDEEAHTLADKIKAIKSEDVLALNDAKHILATYGHRTALGEEHRSNPYGFRTWWLTHETRVRSCTRKLIQSRGSEYIIRPEFILNFVALSPTTQEIRDSYRKIFPTILGVKLSNRMREQVFNDVMNRTKELYAVDEARARAMMSDMSNRLKGDNHRKYEVEWMAKQAGSRGNG